MNQALLLVDLQNDFCPGGALAVKDGDLTIDVANQAIGYFKTSKQSVIASKDWHPANHKSFTSQSRVQTDETDTINGLLQLGWPEHCIQFSHGAEFHDRLNQRLIDKIIYKGQNPDRDSYSAFFDNDKRQKTELDRWLKARRIEKLIIMGLATDYCVKFSVIDALTLGYKVDVVVEGCRGVNLSHNDSEDALREMQSTGANLISLNQLHQSLF